MHRELPLDVRACILLQVQAKDKYDDIINFIEEEHSEKISKGAITNIKRKYEETKYPLDKPRSGRPKLLYPMDEEAIVEAVELNPKLTAHDVYKDKTLNASNVSLRKMQYLLKDHGLLATTTQPKKISANALEDRLSFAENMPKYLSFGIRVVFSDESDMFPYKSGKLYIRRRKGEHPLAYYNMSNQMGSQDDQSLGLYRSRWGRSSCEIL